MADNPYAPSPLGGVAPSPVAPAYAPSMVAPATTGYLQTLPTKPAAAPAPSVYKPSVMDIIAHVETGDRNITQSLGTKDVNNNYGRGGGDPAKGTFQIIDTTYRPAAIKAGIDINKYPTANSLPPSEQARVASFIPTSQWGPATKAAIRAVYPNYDFSKPPPLDYHGGGGAVPTTTTPGTTLTTPPPAASIANALTGANSQGLSPIQQAQKDFGGEGGQALPPAPAPQLGTPNMHNQQVEAQAPQLMAALRTANAQPLSWGSQPFGSTAGPRGGAPPQTMANFGGQLIPMPGTTLNSNAGLYG